MATKFYGETLGIRRKEKADPNFPEFETGNLTLAIVAPEEIGIPFTTLPPGQIALRVPMSMRLVRSWSERVSPFTAIRTTRASARWLSSPIRTETG